MTITIGLLLVVALQAQPINTTCPVKGEKFPVRGIHRVTYEGQLIGFC